MNTELYMEKYRVDMSKDISALLTFSLDDLKDFSARSTTWSKTIVLPGTANNNKLFGHIFQIGQSNTYNSAIDNVGFNFNASKSADCIIFQDQMQTFVGVLRLLQINVLKGKVEYEVSVFGKLAGLNVALSSGLLEELDFSSYDGVFNTTNIIASWDNTPGTGIYYPLIDYGTYGREGGSSGKHDWDIRTFRPAVYVREIIDKMFTAAGYRWSSDLFNTSRFKGLIVPNNQKKLYRLTSEFLSATDGVPRNSNGEGDFLRLDTADPSLDMVENFVKYNTVAISSNFTNGSGTIFTYNQPEDLNVKIKWRFKGYCANCSSSDNFLIGVTKNLATGTNSVSDYMGTGSYDIGLRGCPTPNYFDLSGEFFALLQQNDYLEVFGQWSPSIPGSDAVVVLEESYLIIEGISATLVEASPGDTIGINAILPKNIRQIDFLVSIVKLFNLYVYEDRFDPSLIYFKPYIDFYTTDSSDSVDWTYKLNRDKTITIKPMSEINAKKYEFKYKSDSDYHNDVYRKRYGQGYGDHVFDSEFEFAEQTKAFELSFSATPLIGYVGEDKIYPTIFKRTGSDEAPVEELTDSNIRILQTKKITGVASWDILNDTSVLTSTTSYGYAGHFDDPDAPSNDLNFGILRELFFVLVSGNLTVTQFNVYWSGYMAEITDKDSKLVTANVYLTPKDILDLDFSKFVYIDGVLFRLNKISDYNASKPSDCKVQLLKVNYLIY